MPISRRRALQGLGGLGAVPLLAAAPGGSAFAASPGTSRSETLEVRVRGLRSSAGHRRTTEGRQHTLAGAVTAARSDGTRTDGTRTDETGTDGTGTFAALVTVIGAGGRFADPAAPVSVEQHTFVLPAGTVVGHGTTAADGSGAYAVTGGTGAYHAARGSYVGRRDLAGIGGGTAGYTFTLELPGDRRAD